MSENLNDNKISLNDKYSDYDLKEPFLKGEIGNFDIQDNQISTYEIASNVFQNSIPYIANYILIFLQESTMLIFVSLSIKDKEEQINAINGIGSANMYINITLYSIVIGMISGFNVLGGNALGAKEYRLFGLYFHRSIIINLVVALCIIIIHFFTIDKALLILGVSDSALTNSVNYSKISMFFIIPQIFFSNSFKYLNFAKKGYMVLYPILFSCFLHPLICWALIIKFDLGVIGGAFSILFSQCFNAINVFTYVVLKKPIKGTIFMPNSDSFKDWYNYLIVCLPQAGLICFEWWAYELQILVVTYSSLNNMKVNLSAQIISCNLELLTFVFGNSCFIAIMTINSTYISIGTKTSMINYKNTTKFVFFLNTIFQILIISIFSFFSTDLFSLFTNNEKVIEVAENVMPYLIATIVLASYKNCLQGVICCQRKSLFPNIITLFSYYVIMIGGSIYLTIFKKMGTVGVWISMTIGYAIINLSFIFYLLKIDIKEVIQETQNSVRNDKKSLKRNHDI